jgi:hypothetical protein
MSFLVCIFAVLHAQLKFQFACVLCDRLCGLVVRVPDWISRGPGFDSRHYQVFRVAVGLEGGPLSLVSINGELLERKVAAPVWKTQIKDRGESAALTKRHFLYPQQLALNFSTKLRRLSRYSSFADWRPRSLCCISILVFQGYCLLR